MLRAGLFLNFKGADTLLLWGNTEAIATLHHAMSALFRGDTRQMQISGNCDLSISSGQVNHRASELSLSGAGLEWACSRAVLDDAYALLGDLGDAPSGHHYIDVSGLADQVIVSKNEYPESLRPWQ